VGTEVPIAVAQPRTAAEVEALRAKRSELSRQIESAVSRRKSVERDLLKATDVTRPGLEARLKTLDARIVQIEQEIAANGRALASAPLALAAAEAAEAPVRFGPFTSGQLTAISIVGTVGVLMPLAFAAARAMLIRARQPKLTPEMIEATRRIERMEQAIDAVAVEVERISEGQRFVTQLMAAKQKAPEVLSGPRD
jgi:predicted  nucleic acid-binding Zn-ribbon protein